MQKTGMLGNNRLLRNLLDGPVGALLINLNGEKGQEILGELKKFNRREPCWTTGSNKGEQEMIKRETIRVNREEEITLPTWFGNPLHPKLHRLGPPIYHLSWIQCRQIADGRERTGQDLYRELRSTNLIEQCLNLQDAIEIQKQGVEVFRKFFGRNHVLFWKSVFDGGHGKLFLPFLWENGNEGVVLGNTWLDHRFHPYQLTATFAT